jgi:hypothetical protein
MLSFAAIAKAGHQAAPTTAPAPSREQISAWWKKLSPLMPLYPVGPLNQTMWNRRFKGNSAMPMRNSPEHVNAGRFLVRGGGTLKEGQNVEEIYIQKKAMVVERLENA